MSCNIFTKKNNNSNSIFFSPPNPPHYTIENKNNNNNINSNHFGSLIKEVKFNHELFNNINYPNINIYCYSLKKINDSKNNLIIIYIKNTRPEKKVKNKKKIIINKLEDDILSNNSSLLLENKKKLTIIISQNSKSDLGKIYPRLIDMSNILNCNIISYDYSGFGFSSGKSTIEKINNDIEEVINFSLNFLEIKLEEIVLFGKKIGTIPSIYITSKGNFCSIKGLILLSPIIIDDYNGNNKDKIYIQNIIKNINYIECPVLLIHGKLDDVISFEKCDNLSKKIKECVKWFPEKGDHNNIICDYRSKFYRKLKMFLKKISESKLKIVNKDIDFKGQSLLNETTIKFSNENYNSLNSKNSSLNKEYLFSFDNNKDLKLEDKNIKLLKLDSLNDNEKDSNK